MSKFISDATGVTFSVDDSKDERYQDGYELADKATSSVKKAPAKKAASSKSSTTEK